MISIRYPSKLNGHARPLATAVSAVAVHAAVILLIVYVFSPPIYAADSELESSISDIESAINEAVPNQISKDDIDLSGQKYTFTFFGEKLYSIAKQALRDNIKYIASLIALTAIASLFHMLEIGTSSSPLTSIFTLIEASTATLMIYSAQSHMLSQTSTFISDLSSYMNAMLPIMEGIYIIGGNISAAAVGTTGMMLAFTVIQNLMSAVFTPLVNICTAFTIAGTVDDSKRIIPFLSCVRKLFITLLTFCMTLLSFSMSLQTVLSSNADTVASKSVKFAVSSFIPIVGGAVTDTYNTLSAGGSMLRESAGGIGMIVILLLLLPPLLSLIINKLILDLCAMSARLAGADAVATVFSEASGICTMLIALTVSSALVFMIGILVFSKTKTAV